MDKALAPGATIGIFGSGQLGRMLSVAASRLGLRTHIYSDTSGPAFDVTAKAVVGDYEDSDTVRAFAEQCDVVTYEFENVPLAAADAAGQAAPLHPGREALAVAQDRLNEKTFISGLGIPVAPFAKVDSLADLEAALARIGTPGILKTRRLGYDGKGQSRIGAAGDVEAALASLAGQPAILEGHVNFSSEVSILAVRGHDGGMAFYDVPENTHRNGILATSKVPANVPARVAGDAAQIARQIAEALGYVGVLAVEFFYLADAAAGQQLMVNEIAPRVHNSGHWTLDACLVSQFENHIRAIAGWPLGSTARHSNAVMTNLIGDDVAAWPDLAARADAGVHIYGKSAARPGRKMGHWTALSPKSEPSGG